MLLIFHVGSTAFALGSLDAPHGLAEAQDCVLRLLAAVQPRLCQFRSGPLSDCAQGRKMLNTLPEVFYERRAKNVHGCNCRSVTII